jgi:hypothetical protein
MIFFSVASFQECRLQYAPTLHADLITRRNHMEHVLDSNRRLLLAGGAATAAAAGLGAFGLARAAEVAQSKPLPEYAAWKDARKVIVHTPMTIQSKRGAR